MDDLISRKALIVFLLNVPFLLRHEPLKALIIDWVNQQPPVESVPVVRGEWIDTCPHYHNGVRSNAHKCSICGDYYTTEPEELFFCPRCGADMRKKVQE